MYVWDKYMNKLRNVNLMLFWRITLTVSGPSSQLEKWKRQARSTGGVRAKKNQPAMSCCCFYYCLCTHRANQVTEVALTRHGGFFLYSGLSLYVLLELQAIYSINHSIAQLLENLSGFTFKIYPEPSLSLSLLPAIPTTLGWATIISHFDYFNSLLTGLSASSFILLWYVLNRAAKVILLKG